MTRETETNKEQRTIQLTLSNAVDQTRKIRVEVPAGTTVEEAARESGVFPAGAFDVFTAGGESVTHASVDEHRDEVLYVGPQKVAGGAMEPRTSSRSCSPRPSTPRSATRSCQARTRRSTRPPRWRDWGRATDRSGRSTPRSARTWAASRPRSWLGRCCTWVRRRSTRAVPTNSQLPWKT